jgi:hypothetical protein
MGKLFLAALMREFSNDPFEWYIKVEGGSRKDDIIKKMVGIT